MVKSLVSLKENTSKFPLELFLRNLDFTCGNDFTSIVGFSGDGGCSFGDRNDAPVAQYHGNVIVGGTPGKGSVVSIFWIHDSGKRECVSRN